MIKSKNFLAPIIFLGSFLFLIIGFRFLFGTDNKFIAVLFFILIPLSLIVSSVFWGLSLAKTTNESNILSRNILGWILAIIAFAVFFLAFYSGVIQNPRGESWGMIYFIPGLPITVSFLILAYLIFSKAEKIRKTPANLIGHWLALVFLTILLPVFGLFFYITLFNLLGAIFYKPSI